MEQMYSSLTFPRIVANNFECYVQNKCKTLKGGEKADWPGLLRSKEWHSGEVPGFSFCRIYPRVGTEGARHSGWGQRRLSRELHSPSRQAIMSPPTVCWWIPRWELGLLPPPVRKEAMPTLVSSAPTPRWCQREVAKMEGLQKNPKSHNIIWKYPSFNVKRHSLYKNQEDLKLNQKRQSVVAYTKMMGVRVTWQRF